MKRVLFLCTGNYYRSRFAEIVFNWRSRMRGVPWHAISRGLALDARNAEPISRHTLIELSRRGIPCDGYLRAPLAVCDVDFTGASRVIAIKEAEHRPIIEAQFPAWRDVVEYWHIHDIDCAQPNEALPLLERDVTALLERITVLAA